MITRHRLMVAVKEPCPMTTSSSSLVSTMLMSVFVVFFLQSLDITLAVTADISKPNYLAIPAIRIHDGSIGSVANGTTEVILPFAIPVSNVPIVSPPLPPCSPDDVSQTFRDSLDINMFWNLWNTSYAHGWTTSGNLNTTSDINIPCTIFAMNDDGFTKQPHIYTTLAGSQLAAREFLTNHIQVGKLSLKDLSNNLTTSGGHKLNLTENGDVTYINDAEVEGHVQLPSGGHVYAITKPLCCTPISTGGIHRFGAINGLAADIFNGSISGETQSISYLKKGFLLPGTNYTVQARRLTLANGQGASDNRTGITRYIYESPATIYGGDHNVSALRVLPGLSGTTFLTLLQLTDCRVPLRGDDPVTVFLPTDEAVANLPPRDLKALVSNPERLKQTLLYHIAPGTFTSDGFDGNVSITTVEGKTLRTDIVGNGTLKTVEGAKVILSDIIGHNGVIHVIDRFLYPIPNGTLLETLENSPNLKRFLDLLHRLNLTDYLKGDDPHTVFVPTNNAIDSITSTTPTTVEGDQKLREILINHLVPDIVYTASWSPAKTLTTVGGHTVYLQYEPNESGGFSLLPNGATVSKSDIGATNGVIHIIDEVMPIDYVKSVPSPRRSFWQNIWDTVLGLVGRTKPELISGDEPQTVGDLVATLKKLPNAKHLLDALNNTGLISRLQKDGPYTIFVPVNSAFERLGRPFSDYIKSDRALAEKVLLNHIVPNELFCDDLRKIKSANTLDKKVLTISPSEVGCAKVDDNDIIYWNITAKDGVIHLIDSVLLSKELENLLPSTTEVPSSSSSSSSPLQTTTGSPSSTTITWKPHVTEEDKLSTDILTSTTSMTNLEESEHTEITTSTTKPITVSTLKDLTTLGVSDVTTKQSEATTITIIDEVVTIKTSPQVQEVTVDLSTDDIVQTTRMPSIETETEPDVSLSTVESTVTVKDEEVSISITEMTPKPVQYTTTELATPVQPSIVTQITEILTRTSESPAIEMADTMPSSSTQISTTLEDDLSTDTDDGRTPKTLEDVSPIVTEQSTTKMILSTKPTVEVTLREMEDSSTISPEQISTTEVEEFTSLKTETTSPSVTEIFISSTTLKSTTEEPIFSTTLGLITEESFSSKTPKSMTEESIISTTLRPITKESVPSTTSELITEESVSSTPSTPTTEESISPTNLTTEFTEVITTSTTIIAEMSTSAPTDRDTTIILDETDKNITTSTSVPFESPTVSPPESKVFDPFYGIPTDEEDSFSTSEVPSGRAFGDTYPSIETPILYIPTNISDEDTLSIRKFVNFTTVTNEDPISLTELFRQLNLTKLSQLLNNSGLEENLSKRGALTIFAPTDEAFDKLDKETLDNLFKDEEQIKRLLLYHIIPSRVTGDDLPKIVQAITLAGVPVFINVQSFDGKTTPLVNNATILPVQHKKNATIIFMTNDVLISPPEGDIFTTLNKLPMTDTMKTLIINARLDPVMTGPGPITMFVPSDNALKQLPQNVKEQLSTNMTAMKDYVLRHIVGGAVFTPLLTADKQFKTLTGNPLKITRDNGVISVNSAKIVQPDIVATNGVIHIIDSLFDETMDEEVVSPATSTEEVSTAETDDTTRPDVTEILSTISPKLIEMQTTTPPEVTELPSATTPEVTELSSITPPPPEVTDMKSTIAPEVTELPSTRSPKVAELPSTIAPEVTELPSTTIADITDMKSTTTLEVAKLPSTTTSEVPELPSTTAPEVTEIPTTISQEISELPLTTKQQVTELPPTTTESIAETETTKSEEDLSSTIGIQNYSEVTVSTTALIMEETTTLIGDLTSSQPNITQPGLLPLLMVLRREGLTTFAQLLESIYAPKILNLYGIFTLFAPTNMAFESLSPSELQDLESDPQALQQMLMHHAISKIIPYNEITDRQEVMSIQGTNLTFNVYDDDDRITKTIQGKEIIRPDIKVIDGLVHVIDSLLYPIPRKKILETVDYRFPSFSAAINDTVNRHLLSDRGVTVFVPAEEFWNKLPQSVQEEVFSNLTIMDDLVKDHVCAGRTFYSGIRDGASCTTVSGKTLAFNVTGDEKYVNTVPIVLHDIIGTDGVIHVIERPLFLEIPIFEDDAISVIPARPTRPVPIATSDETTPSEEMTSSTTSAKTTPLSVTQYTEPSVTWKTFYYQPDETDVTTVSGTTPAIAEATTIAEIDLKKPDEEATPRKPKVIDKEETETTQAIEVTEATITTLPDISTIPIDLPTSSREDESTTDLTIEKITVGPTMNVTLDVKSLTKGNETVTSSTREPKIFSQTFTTSVETEETTEYIDASTVKYIATEDDNITQVTTMSTTKMADTKEDDFPDVTSTSVIGLSTSKSEVVTITTTAQIPETSDAGPSVSETTDKIVPADAKEETTSTELPATSIRDVTEIDETTTVTTMKLVESTTPEEITEMYSPEFAEKTTITPKDYTVTEVTQTASELNVTREDEKYTEPSIATPVSTAKPIPSLTEITTSMETITEIVTRITPVSDQTIESIIENQFDKVGYQIKTTDLISRFPSGKLLTACLPQSTFILNLDPTLIYNLINNETFVGDVFSDHICPTTINTAQLNPNISCISLSGKPIDLWKENDKYYCNESPIVEKDILTKNGVVHLIDGFLFVEPESDQSITSTMIPDSLMTSTITEESDIVDKTVVTTDRLTTVVPTIREPKILDITTEIDDVFPASSTTIDDEQIATTVSGFTTLITQPVTEVGISDISISESITEKPSTIAGEITATTKSSIFTPEITKYQETTFKMEEPTTEGIDTESISGTTTIAGKPSSPPNNTIATIIQDEFHEAGVDLDVSVLTAILPDRYLYTAFIPHHLYIEEQLPSSLLEVLIENNSAVLEFVANHICPDSTLSDQFETGYTCTSLGGTEIQVTETDGKYYVNGFPIVQVDKRVADGVVHLIDGVLVAQADNVTLTSTTEEPSIVIETTTIIQELSTDSTVTMSVGSQVTKEDFMTTSDVKRDPKVIDETTTLKTTVEAISTDDYTGEVTTVKVEEETSPSTPDSSIIAITKIEPEVTTSDEITKTEPEVTTLDDITKTEPEVTTSDEITKTEPEVTTLDDITKTEPEVTTSDEIKETSLTTESTQTPEYVTKTPETEAESQEPDTDSTETTTRSPITSSIVDMITEGTIIPTKQPKIINYTEISIESVDEFTTKTTTEVPSVKDIETISVVTESPEYVTTKYPQVFNITIADDQDYDGDVTANVTEFHTSTVSYFEKDKTTVIPFYPADEGRGQLSVSVFFYLIELSHVDDVLAKGGPYTILAPVDAAFQGLPEQVMHNLKDNMPFLKNVILYHILPTKIMSTDLHNDNLLTTLQGQDVRSNIYGQVLTIGGARIVLPDSDTGYGVVHIVNKVLYPLPNGTALDTLQPRNDTDRVQFLISNSSLPQRLKEPGSYTVFIPSDRALDSLPLSVIEKLERNSSILEEFVLNHMVNSTYYTEGMSEGLELVSMGGQLLRISLSGGLTVNGVPIVTPDISVTNGVVHVVDKILYNPLEGLVLPKMKPTISNQLNVVELARQLNLTTFVNLLSTSGLTANLSEPGPFTLLVPTNEAFAAMPPSQLNKITSDPDHLRRILMYHILPIRLPTTMMINEMLVPSLSSNSTVRMNIYVNKHGPLYAASGSQIVSPNNEASNGLVHIVQQVLYIPLGDIVKTVERCSILQTLRHIITVSGLTNDLKVGNYTLFAPNDAAFNKVPEDVLERLMVDPDFAKTFVLGHLLRGTTYTEGIFDETTMSTMSNSSFYIRALKDCILLNSAAIQYPDVTTDNGVVHVIDRVL